MMRERLLRHWPLKLALLLALCCALCVWRVYALSHLLLSQQAAERWQGEGERRFAQISCFLPTAANLTLDEVYKFRNDMFQKLKGASFDVENETGLYRDAWSAFSTARVSRGRQVGTVHVIAVGGDFFDFHPLRLVSGNYLRPSDVMDDRVLLDRETAWLLFGASDVAGLSFSLGSVPMVAAGVYAHEADTFSRHACGDGMYIYMSYSAYCRLIDTDAQIFTGISGNPKSIGCYELVIAEPVKGFAYGAVSEKFPYKAATLVENSYRFESERLLRLATNRIERSMRMDNNTIPYWENAARAAEDRAALFLLAALITGAFPLALLLFALIRSAVAGKRRLEGDVLPGTKRRTREFIRERSRRRWERRHPEEAAAAEAAEAGLSDEESNLL